MYLPSSLILTEFRAFLQSKTTLVNKFKYLGQGSTNYGPRAGTGPLTVFIRPAPHHGYKRYIFCCCYDGRNQLWRLPLPPTARLLNPLPLLPCARSVNSVRRVTLPCRHVSSVTGACQQSITPVVKVLWCFQNY